MKPNTKVIAGVSVNLNSPPSYERLVEMALKGKDYYRKPLREAKRSISNELRLNGFTRPRRKKSKKQKDN